MSMDKRPPSSTCPSSHEASWIRLRELYRSFEPPAELEARILAKVATERHAARRSIPPRSRSPWVLQLGQWLGMRPLAGLGLALSLLVLVGLGGFWLGELSGRSSMAENTNPTAASSISAVPLDTPYILIQAPAHGKLEPAQVIRIDLPRATMRDFGWPVPAAELDGQVRTELLLGAHGELLALRFLGSSGSQEGRSDRSGVVVAGLTF